MRSHRSFASTPTGSRGWFSAGSALRFAVVLPLLVNTVWMLIHPLPLQDFAGYWAAARLFLTHHNPYSSDALLSLERAQGWGHPHPLVMLCPPWVLTILSPFGALSYHAARIAWFVVSLLLDAASAILLGQYFGGTRRAALLALVIFGTFAPLGTSEYLGQFTPLILFSLAVFLTFLRRDRPSLAGIALLGLTIKPHLLWLMLLAILCWSLRERRFRLLVSGSITVGLTLLVAVVTNGATVHYLHNAYGPAMDTMCGVGGALRLAFGAQHTWLQYVPCLAGAVWFVWYWRRHGQHWDWPKHLPLLLIVSIVSAPYCWFHDYILALPAFVALAVRGGWRSPLTLVGWVIVQMLILAPHDKALESLMSVLWIGFWLLASEEISHIDSKATVSEVVLAA